MVVSDHFDLGQGLYKQEGKDRYGENYRMWQKDAANFEIDGHYPVRELWERAQSCWQSILKSEGESILVVAHNAVNQALVATATGLLLTIGMVRSFARKIEIESIM